jgi:hypothetical protein
MKIYPLHLMLYNLCTRRSVLKYHNNKICTVISMSYLTMLCEVQRLSWIRQGEQIVIHKELEKNGEEAIVHISRYFSMIH